MSKVGSLCLALLPPSFEGCILYSLVYWGSFYLGECGKAPLLQLVGVWLDIPVHCNAREVPPWAAPLLASTAASSLSSAPIYRSPGQNCRTWCLGRAQSKELTLSGFGVCDLHIHFFRMVLMPSWGDGSGMSSVG